MCFGCRSVLSSHNCKYVFSTSSFLYGNNIRLWSLIRRCQFTYFAVFCLHNFLSDTLLLSFWSVAVWNQQRGMLEGDTKWQDVLCLHCEFKCCLAFPNAVRFVVLLLELVLLWFSTTYLLGRSHKRLQMSSWISGRWSPLLWGYWI